MLLGTWKTETDNTYFIPNITVIFEILICIHIYVACVCVHVHVHMCECGHMQTSEETSVSALIFYCVWDGIFMVSTLHTAGTLAQEPWGVTVSAPILLQKYWPYRYTLLCLVFPGFSGSKLRSSCWYRSVLLTKSSLQPQVTIHNQHLKFRILKDADKYFLNA